MISTYAETEDDLQKRVVEWLNVALPPGCVFHHSPNEGRRHVAFKRKLRQMGTQYGWPDLEVFVPGDQAVHGVSTSIFIELKRLKGGKLNAESRRDEGPAVACRLSLGAGSVGRTGSRDTEAPGQAEGRGMKVNGDGKGWTA